MKKLIKAIKNKFCIVFGPPKLCQDTKFLLKYPNFR